MTQAPQDPAFETRVRTSFGRQALMATLGAQLMSVEPGRVIIELPFHADHTQQHGFLHAGVLTAIADSACGYAALSLMSKGTAVLSVEFKVNLLKPASGTRFRSIGTVARAGHTLSVCTADVQALREGVWKDVAMMQATMMTIRDRGELND